MQCPSFYLMRSFFPQKTDLQKAEKNRPCTRMEGRLQRRFLSDGNLHKPACSDFKPICFLLQFRTEITEAFRIRSDRLNGLDLFGG